MSRRREQTPACAATTTAVRNNTCPGRGTECTKSSAADIFHRQLPKDVHDFLTGRRHHYIIRRYIRRRFAADEHRRRRQSPPERLIGTGRGGNDEQCRFERAARMPR